MEIPFGTLSWLILTTTTYPISLYLPWDGVHTCLCFDHLHLPLRHLQLPQGHIDSTLTLPSLVSDGGWPGIPGLKCCQLMMWLVNRTTTRIPSSQPTITPFHRKLPGGTRMMLHGVRLISRGSYSRATKQTTPTNVRTSHYAIPTAGMLRQPRRPFTPGKCTALNKPTSTSDTVE